MDATNDAAIAADDQSRRETGTAVVDTDATTRELAALYEGDAGAGFDETTADDFTLPFLSIIQKGSPQADPDQGEYIEGARPGMFYDTAAGDISDSVDFVVCHYHRSMVEWRDRKSGGGYVAQHDVGYEDGFEQEIDSETGRWTGRWRTGPDTCLVDTRYFFGLRLLDDGSTALAVVSMASTQTKKAKAWMSRMDRLKGVSSDGRKFRLPMYASVWHLTTVPEENVKGAWRGFKIDYLGPVTDQSLAAAARKAREMFVGAAGSVRPPADTDSGADVPF